MVLYIHIQLVSTFERVADAIKNARHWEVGVDLMELWKEKGIPVTSKAYNSVLSACAASKKVRRKPQLTTLSGASWGHLWLLLTVAFVVSPSVSTPTHTCSLF